MNEEKKGVETKTENAPVQQETVATQTATEVDYEAIIAAKDAEIAKVAAEKENYKKGLLKAKGKLPEDDQSDTDSLEDMETIIDRKVTEKLLSTKEAQLQAERDNALKAVLKRNKELELALKNRGQITSASGSGSNQDKPEVRTDNYFSPEQISALKAKGFDDKKIETLKNNLAKVNRAI